MFNKIDGFIKVHDKIIVLFDEWRDKICDMIKYLTNKKSDITYSINRNFAINRIDSLQIDFSYSYNTH